MGRPSVPKLTRDKIAAVALELIDATGRFTIPELARRLDVQPSSLYKHVSGRDEIVELVRERIHAEGPEIDVEAPWQEVVRQVATYYRDVWGRHPHFVPMLAMSTVQAGAAMASVRNFALVLSRAGFDPHETLMIMGTVDLLAFGGALDAGAPDDIYAPETREQMNALGDAVRSVSSGAGRADAVWAYSIDLLIESLEQRLAAHAGT